MTMQEPSLSSYLTTDWPLALFQIDPTNTASYLPTYRHDDKTNPTRSISSLTYPTLRPTWQSTSQLQTPPTPIPYPSVNKQTNIKQTPNPVSMLNTHTNPLYRVDETRERDCNIPRTQPTPTQPSLFLAPNPTSPAQPSLPNPANEQATGIRISLIDGQK
ncbi:hypothetical protein BO94DRAFT_530346 [Aspergillus sclerotioniger CBS 115572]|uniref:Uncharacterized protein n=1 Tax=Aspergillus sclerotioniger CBS 115572 TaxID=1450535 RepID=A0A317XAK9_9EURO|nr:hypothetical protein BO94DRAFT_530346 [Aspergillus sclerotioniger CBS 115572]PWY95623.1 hypothetical protein BO94DRAFT_530346 [Aspergillus sclerotioniger CBS 115572]